MKLKDILNEIQEKVDSKREKGEKFEKLMKNWFLTTKLYADDIKKYGYGMNFHIKINLVVAIA